MYTRVVTWQDLSLKYLRVLQCRRTTPEHQLVAGFMKDSMLNLVLNDETRVYQDLLCNIWKERHHDPPTPL